MNDVAKGISILSLTALAIALAVQFNNNSWEIPLITFQSDSQREALELQREILAGVDPTLTQEPTAAGNSTDNRSYQGWLTVTDPILRLDKATYFSVEEESKLYLRTLGDNYSFEMHNLYASELKQIEKLPESIVFSLANFGQFKTECARKDLLISKVIQ